MKQVHIKKIEELKDAEHKNNIMTGREFYGLCDCNPVVGHCFVVGNMRTSTVQEILSPNTFRSSNSVYEWHEVKSAESKKRKPDHNKIEMQGFYIREGINMATPKTIKLNKTDAERMNKLWREITIARYGVATANQIHFEAGEYLWEELRALYPELLNNATAIYNDGVVTYTPKEGE